MPAAAITGIPFEKSQIIGAGNFSPVMKKELEPFVGAGQSFVLDFPPAIMAAIQPLRAAGEWGGGEVHDLEFLALSGGDIPRSHSFDPAAGPSLSA